MRIVVLCEVDLEDVNTKRLSLRIQLAQLMKERSLLLCNMSIEWCVCLERLSILGMVIYSWNGCPFLEWLSILGMVIFLEWNSLQSISLGIFMSLINKHLTHSPLESPSPASLSPPSPRTPHRSPCCTDGTPCGCRWRPAASPLPPRRSARSRTAPASTYVTPLSRRHSAWLLAQVKRLLRLLIVMP